MKIAIIRSVIVAFFAVTLWQDAALAQGSLRICHVSSRLGHDLPRALDLPRRQAGFKAAIRQFNTSQALTAEFLEFDDETQAVPSKIDEAERAGCHVIVGLVRSRDALIAAPSLERHGMLGFSSTAKSSRLNAHFPTVLSAATCSTAWGDAADRALQDVSEIALVVRPGDEFSHLVAIDLQKALTSPLRVLELNDELLLEPKALASLHGKHAVFIFTTYPFVSLPGIQQLGRAGQSEWRVLANHSWTETHVLTRRPDILAASPPIFTLSPWVPSLTDGKTGYHVDIMESLREEFDHDSVYDFDVANMILRCFRRQPKPHDLRAHIKSCLTLPHTYEGSTGLYVFNGTQAHPERNHRLLRITNSGLTPHDGVL